MTDTTTTATAKTAKPKAAAKTPNPKAAPRTATAKPKAAPKAKGETKKTAGPPAAPAKPEKAAVPDTRPAKPLAAHVVELIALLKTKIGATNEEAAQKIKGFKKARDVRAAIRDKVRKLHTVTKEHDGTRGGAVFRIK